MDKDFIICEIEKYVKEKLEGEGSGHDYYHVVRVLNNSIDIANDEVNVDIFVVKLAALLHDIADHKFGYTDEDRVHIIKEILIKYDVDTKTIDSVIYIVNNISFKGGKNKHVMKCIEAQIVQDADRLDAIGAIGIGRTFAYGGFVKREMYSLVNENNNDTISHFYQKLLLLKDKMNTVGGKRKAEIRHKFMEQFLDMFYSEWNSKI